MYIDIFLLVLLAWAVFSGWRNGFVKEAFNTLGLIVGLAFALLVYSVMGECLTVDGSTVNKLLSIVAFLLLCIVMPIVCGFAANVLTHAIRSSLLGLPNSLLGVGFSVLKFLLLVSFAFNVMNNLCIVRPDTAASSLLFEPVSKVLPFVRTEAGHCLQSHFDEARPDTTYIDFDRSDRDLEQRGDIYKVPEKR